MELPSDPRARHALFRDTIRRCELPSRPERRERYRRLRALALTGTDSADRARFNSLMEWIKLSTSLIYAQHGVQFGVTYPPYYGDAWDEETVLAREELHRLWFDGPSPGIAREAIEMAHFADTAVVKLFVSRNEVGIDVISDPSDIGVLDEHLRWDQQEAIVNWFSLSLPAFRRLLLALPDRTMRERLWREAQDHAQPGDTARGDVLPPAVNRIILSSASPNVIGQVVNAQDTVLAIPRSRDPVIPLAELWVWDDHAAEVCHACQERKGFWRHQWPEPVGHAFERGDPPEYVPDWRVVTNFLPTEEILWEPVNPLGIEGHAFFPLCLEPTPGYTWGVAPMEHLIGPQLWREQKLGELNLRDDLDVNPPMSAYGVPMRDGETTRGYRKPGADIPLNTPQARVEFHRPPPLADPFQFVDKIDGMMRLLQGIPKSMAGQTEAGIRSGEQAFTQAMLGASPTLSRAMVVEDWLEGIATAMLRVQRNLLARELVKADGSRFLLSQMPGDFVARVWAHSASPIYTEQIKTLALAAHQRGLLSNEDTLAFLNLPGTDMLLRRAKKLEEGQAEMKQKIVELKERETKAKELKAAK